jgi:TonB-linked SusC/RagA family outer membrane protein
MYKNIEVTRLAQWETKMLRIMKLIIILLTAAALQVSAKGHSQGITLSLKDVTLKTALTQIRKQAPNFDFFYDESWLKEANKVSIEVKNASLNEVLEQCFKNQPFTFSVAGSIITVHPKNNPTTAADKNIPINITIKGVIINEANEPVEGASIKVKNTDKGTSSNERGEFALEDVAEDGVLEISHVTYETLEVPIKKKTEIRVSLKAKMGKLSDVTINTGYQTLKVNQVTGSVTTLREDELDRRVAPDIISKLEGITNGLVFNKDPLTGKNQLRIRGESTIYGYTEPLIVVDNFPYDGDITEINPNDVESISVLKDAAAASIWGVRAGNGVIVITTKKGRVNQPLRLEINSNYTLTDKPDLFYSPYINPSDYIDYEIFSFGKGRYNSDLTDPNFKVVSPVVEILNNRANGLISSADSASQINTLRSKDWRKSYLDHLYRQGVTQQYQINASGGGNKAAYYFSGGYDRILGVVNGNKDDRITFTSRTSYNPIKNLEIQTEINYVESSSKPNGISDVPSIYPYMQIADDNGNELNIPQFRSTWEDTIGNHGFLNWKYSPLQEQRLRNTVIRNFTTRISTQIKYTIFKGLNASASYQYYRTNTKGRQVVDKNSYSIRNLTNKFAILDANNNFVGSNYPDGGELNLSTGEIVGHNGRFKLEYNNSWQDHFLTVVAGADVREVRSETNTSRFLGYDDANGSFTTPNTFQIYPTYPTGNSSFGDGTALGLSYSSLINRYRSFFGNILYSYKDRYSVSTSARLDQANIFGVNTNDKGTPLWSVGGKWDIWKEKFYKIKAVSNLALRVTYGYQGNLSPDAVAIVTLKYRTPALYTGLPTAEINNFPNPELRWEKSGQLNIGLDFNLLNSRISGTIDYFKKKGTDLIGNAPIDITTGISSLRGNFSDMKSKGIDFVVTSQNFVGKKFNWTSTLIFNYAAETITRYDDPVNNAQLFKSYLFTAPKVDYPVRSIFSYRWGGLDPNTGDPRILLADTINKSYNNITLNNIKFSDLVYSGRYNPPYAGSLQNTFTWRDLSFTFNVTYKLGHYFRRSSIRYSDFEYSWMGGNKDFAKRWQSPGDEATTNVPSLVYPNPSTIRDDYYLFSDELIEKADHIRLQFISLNYQLPSSLAAKMGFRNINFYLYANNLGILWRANKSGIDPDYPYLNYPPSKSYSIGIRAGL